MTESCCSVLNIAFVGAGGVNFGGGTGPWDHSARLEQMIGVRFVAIVDPDTPKAARVLERKLTSNAINKHLYKDCRLYTGIAELFLDQKPDVVVLGIPPGYRGSTEKGKDVELQIVRRGVNLFVEKPVSIVHFSKFTDYAEQVEKARQESGVVVSVGYMFRYHDAVERAKHLILSHGGKVMMFNARFYIAYSQKDHQFWWDADKAGGPVVEQATHFYDIARFLAGNVKINTIEARYLREGDEGGAGKLSKVPGTCERDIPPSKRIPRAHIATWRFEEGGLGTLTHVVALHGHNYETSIDIVMDGLRLTLCELYTDKCKLHIRRTGSDDETVEGFGAADPYRGELEAFIKAVINKDPSLVRSPYIDAEKSYRFSWAVKLAAESGNDQ